MILSSTYASVTTALSTMLYQEVRCPKCGRLLFKWEHRGMAGIEVKCPRCGWMDQIQLSTS